MNNNDRIACSFILFLLFYKNRFAVFVCVKNDDDNNEVYKSRTVFLLI